MSIRFASFEAYKNFLADKETGKTSVGNIFVCAFHPLAVPFDARLTSFRLFDVISWLGRWCHRSCRRRVSNGGREDPATGTDALPRRSPGDSPVPKCWTRRVQDYS